MATQSDYNLRQISTKELSETFRTTIEYGCSDPEAPAAIFVVGRRGTGKTFIAKDEIAASAAQEITINISVSERVDLAGFPKLFTGDTNSKYVAYLLPEHFKLLMDGNKPVVALLDEVDKADSSLHGPLLEFVQMKAINGRRFPNLVCSIMTANLQAEGGHRPSLPLLDRAEGYLVEADVKNWLDWCGSNTKARIHPSITAFISDHSDELFSDVDAADESYKSPSPRGWHNYSKILNFGEERKWSPNTLITKAAGCVGKKAGIRYEAYFTHYQVLCPLAEKIMKGENVPEYDALDPSKKMVACMIVCSRLARLLDIMAEKKEKLPPQSKTVVKFLKDVDPEMALTSIRGQISINRVIASNLLNEKHWDDLVGGMVKKINGK
jgi:hypothetical protein